MVVGSVVEMLARNLFVNAFPCCFDILTKNQKVCSQIRGTSPIAENGDINESI